MAVSNGQPGDENTFNNAYISKTTDSTTVGKIDLNNADAASGVQVTNTQREHNSAASYIGKAINALKDVLPAWTSTAVGTASDDLTERAEALTVFAGTKGAANGIAPLDGSAQVPLANLPDSVTGAREFLGNWAASTNTPTLADGDVETAGSEYNVSDDGTVDFGAGNITFTTGDTVIYNGSIWSKIDGSVVRDLNDIRDVVETSTQNRDQLVNDGTDWKNFDPNQIGNDAAAGANQTLTAPGGLSVVRLTGALTSLDGVPDPGYAQKFILVNATGGTVTVNNETGGTAADRILTGTGSNLDLADDGVLVMVYDSTDARWRITGGSGGGGIDIGASTDNAITRWDGTAGNAVQDSGVTISDTNNMVVPGTVEPQGGITNGAETITDDTLVKLRNSDSGVAEYDILRYDGATNNYTPVASDQLNIIKGSESDFETSNIAGWLVFADPAGTIPENGDGGIPTVTFTHTTSGGEILNGTGSGKLSKDAASRQGEGVSVGFNTVGKSFRGKACRVSFSYDATAAFDYGTISTDSDVTVWGYCQTTSTLLPLNNSRLSGEGRFEADLFMPSGCALFRLILFIPTTNASAWDLIVDDVRVELVPFASFNNMSDWVDAGAMTIGADTSAPTKGTVIQDRVQYRQVGSNYQCEYDYEQTAAGTAGSGEYIYDLPDGIQFDDEIIDFYTGSIVNGQSKDMHRAMVGSGHQGIDASARGTNSCIAINSTQFKVIAGSHYAGYQAQSSTYFTLSNANQGMKFRLDFAGKGITSGAKHPAAIGLNAQAITRVGGDPANTTINTPIIWPTVFHDSVGAYNNTTGEYTAKSPGFYEFNGNVVGPTVVIINAYVNGALAAQVGRTTSAAQGSFVGTQYLNYGDVLTIRPGGASVDFSGATGNSFNIHKLGSEQQPYAPRVAYLKDTKPSGTNGGTFTAGAWQTRVINTLSADESFVSLSSNQFTLQPGTYHIEASAPAYAVNNHKCKLRNITDSADIAIGSSAYSRATLEGDQTLTSISDTFTISSTKTFEIQHRCAATLVTNGFGVTSTFGVDEIYTQVKITKIL